MINYSIVMRSVNANLLEINQAKSRINQAKKEGTTPDPKVLSTNHCQLTLTLAMVMFMYFVQLRIAKVKTKTRCA